jgi:transposase
MARRKGPKRGIAIAMDKIEQVLERAERNALTAEDCELLRELVTSYAYVTNLVEHKQATLARLRQILFGIKTEKTANVFPEEAREEEGGLTSEASARPEEPGADAGREKQRQKGHGRNGAKAYEGAETETVCHACLKAGDLCPECGRGKVYELPEPKRLVRVLGQAPLSARVIELERLRCNLCGRVFCAKAPPGVGEEKYDASAASMIALLKYGTGLPFYRLEKLEENLGIPLPAATQWDIVNRLAPLLRPVHDELIRQAAQGEVLHNDDTGMKILELMGKRRPSGKEAGGRAVFTSGIVSIVDGRKVALFFTGPKHAGERLDEVLAARAAELGAPIQMCDALSRNAPGAFETILASCLTHGRRKFVDVAKSFPVACRHVIEVLREVYRIDARAVTEGMTKEGRLALHQTKSKPLMDDLKEWLAQQIVERKVEPNSGLGQAIRYMQNHWEKLTLFLREAGAPLDNNLCERALKKAILHRKNALFYKTQKGAQVGDLFMSLIHTAELCGANAFDYLTELQRHQRAARSNPAAWMPWRYREALPPS